MTGTAPMCLGARRDISPTIDAVKSQLHTTEVLRFITRPDYV